MKIKTSPAAAKNTVPNETKSHFKTEQSKKVLEIVKLGLWANGITRIKGRMGVGKTTALKAAVSEMGEEARYIFMVGATHAPNETRAANYILRKFLGDMGRLSRNESFFALDQLAQSLKDHEIRSLIIDDAQEFPGGALYMATKLCRRCESIDWNLNVILAGNLRPLPQATFQEVAPRILREITIRSLSAPEIFSVLQTWTYELHADAEKVIITKWLKKRYKVICETTGGNFEKLRQLWRVVQSDLCNSNITLQRLDRLLKQIEPVPLQLFFGLSS